VHVHLLKLQQQWKLSAQTKSSKSLSSLHWFELSLILINTLIKQYNYIYSAFPRWRHYFNDYRVALAAQGWPVAWDRHWGLSHASLSMALMSTVEISRIREHCNNVFPVLASVIFRYYRTWNLIMAARQLAGRVGRRPLYFTSDGHELLQSSWHKKFNYWKVIDSLVVV